MPCSFIKEVKAIDSPPKSEWIVLIGRWNCFSTNNLNYLNIDRDYAFDLRG